MCGIAGIIFQNTEADEAILVKMTQAIAHRGPDGFGHWISPTRQAGLGHRRLSILDLSTAASQPMHYAGRYAIVFNGEIYNYIEIKDWLLKKGLRFTTTSDTETLIALYAEKGVDCLHELDGMFAFAIWDQQEKTLFCARDRFGEKPFFYSYFNGKFYFASEIKALWAAGIPKTPDRRRLFDYLAYQQEDDAENRDSTFFEGIFQLEPAHYLITGPGRHLLKKMYWTIDESRQDRAISFEASTEKFLELFTRSIRRRLRSDVPVGSSLSGGLDSSSIVRIIGDSIGNGSRQRTFSARFPGHNLDEGKYIELMVQNRQIEAHMEFLTAERLAENLDTVCHQQDEPFGSTSIVAQWEVMKLAKKNNVTVLLDGQGADEFLAGYFHYFSIFFNELYKNNRSIFAAQLKKYRELYGVDFPVSKYIGLKTFSTSFVPIIKGIKDLAVRIAGHSLRFNHLSSDFIQSARFGWKPGPPVYSSLNTALKYETLTKGLPTLLRYADRNSMAHSREVRLPFLSHELVEFVFQLPSHYKILDGWNKALLRFAMNSRLPKEICWRKIKVAFQPPQSKTIGKDRLEESLSILRRENIIKPSQYDPTLEWEYFQAAKLFDAPHSTHR